MSLSQEHCKYSVVPSSSKLNHSNMTPTQGELYPLNFLRNNCEFYFGFHFIKLTGIFEEKDL